MEFLNEAGKIVNKYKDDNVLKDVVPKNEIDVRDSNNALDLTSEGQYIVFNGGHSSSLYKAEVISDNDLFLLISKLIDFKEVKDKQEKFSRLTPSAILNLINGNELDTEKKVLLLNEISLEFRTFAVNVGNGFNKLSQYKKPRADLDPNDTDYAVKIEGLNAKIKNVKDSISAYYRYYQIYLQLRQKLNNVKIEPQSDEDGGNVQLAYELINYLNDMIDSLEVDKNGNPVPWDNLDNIVEPVVFKLHESGGNKERIARYNAEKAKNMGDTA